MAKMSTFDDGFDVMDTGKWVFGSTVSVATGKLVLPGNEYALNASIKSVAAYDLTFSTAAFDLDSVPTTTSADGPFFTMELYSGADQDTGDRISAHLYMTTTASIGWNFQYKSAAGVTSNDYGTVYSGTALMRYLRIRHDGSNVIWETSGDATTWVTRRTAPTATIGFTTLGAMRVALRAGADVANTGAFRLNGFNPGETIIAAVTAPGVPTGLAVTTPTNSSLTVSWAATATATSYLLERSTTSATAGFTSVATPTGTSVVNSGLSPTTTYWYRVSALNSGGSSAASAAVSGTTAAGTTTVLIADTFDNYGAAGTTVWPAVNDGSSPTNSPFNDAGLSLWEVYYNANGALAIGGTTDKYLLTSVAAARTLLLSKSPATGDVDITINLNRTGSGPDVVTAPKVGWGYQAGAAFTLAFKQANGTGGWSIASPAGTLLAQGAEQSTQNVAVKHRIVHQGTTITYYRNDALISTITGQATVSGRVSWESQTQCQLLDYTATLPGSTVVTPPPPVVITVPSAPATISGSVTSTTITTNWTAPATLNNGTLQGYTVALDGAAPVTVSSTTLTYTHTGLPAGSGHTVVVRALNEAGAGAAATRGSTTTIPAPVASLPSEPLNVAAVLTGVAGSAVVSWTVPTTLNGTITHYQVVDQNGTLRATVAGNVLSATVSGLTIGVSFAFRVRAEDGEALGTYGALSLQSNGVISTSSGSTTSALKTRSSLGAWLPNHDLASVTDLESAVGQRLQPVAVEVNLGGPLPSAAWLQAVTSQGSRPMLRLGLVGKAMTSLLNGSLNADLEAIRVWTQTTSSPVFITVLPSPNDWANPWAPSYTLSSPGYVASLDAGTTNEVQYKLALDVIIRFFRTRQSPNVRFGFEANIDPQSVADDNNWIKFYPGDPLIDYICLAGFNYGEGDAVGAPGRTVWRTASAIFIDQYNGLNAYVNTDKPVYFVTGSHDPSVSFTGSAGAVPVDTVNSKVTWLTELMELVTFPRVQAVIWRNGASTRNWGLTSSAGVTAAAKATITGGVSWEVATEQEDSLGGYTRLAVRNFASWAQSGGNPAPRLNDYARPDARPGAKCSLVFALPYSPGTKVGPFDIPEADELAYNKVHGLLLRELARNGMTGWAYGSGPLADDDPALLFHGSVTSTGLTLLDNALDTQPGALTQIAGGMTLATAGKILSNALPAPTASIMASVAGLYTDPTTQIGLNWAPLTAAQSTGYAITGYRFGWSTTDPRASTSAYLSEVYQPSIGTPFVFTLLVPGVAYTVFVEVVASNGTVSRRALAKTTAAATVTQVPSAPTAVNITNVGQTTLTANWAPPVSAGASAIDGYSVGWEPTPDGSIYDSSLTDTPAASRSFAMTNFAPGTDYRVRVRAHNSFGYSAPTIVSVKTLAPATSTPGTGGAQGMPARVWGLYSPQYNGPYDLNTSITQSYNTIMFFAMNTEHTVAGSVDQTLATGKVTWDIATPANLAAARTRGQRIIISVGGARATINYPDRGISQKTVDSIVAINQQWGGTLANPVIDGADFNTFETVENTRNTPEYIWMGLELKRLFGSKFFVSAPPAPWNPADKALAKACLDAGAWDFVTPQYYDGQGAATQANIVTKTTEWVRDVASGDASKVGVGFGLLTASNGPDYSTLAVMQAAWDQIEATYPSIRGAFLWEYQTDKATNWSVGNSALGTDVKTAGPN